MHMYGLSEERRNLQAFLQNSNGARNSIVMTAEERLTAEDIRYLKVAIALALGSPDVDEMSKTKTELNKLYHRIERMEGVED